jgi:hypothetical protein
MKPQAAEQQGNKATKKKIDHEPDSFVLFKILTNIVRE